MNSRIEKLTELTLQGKTIDLQYDRCPNKIAHDQEKEYKTLIKKIDNYNQISSKDKDMITCFFDVGDGIAVSYKK